MGTVRAAIEVTAATDAVERAWYDTARWTDWVDGLEEVREVRDPWPEPGGELSWRSGPAGRGEVSERVTGHRPGAGQTVAVHDDQTTGEQTVSFAARPGGTHIELALTYRLRRRNPLTALVDLLFIRRAMTEALAHTLERFAAAVEAPPESRLGG